MAEQKTPYGSLPQGQLAKSTLPAGAAHIPPHVAIPPHDGGPNRSFEFPTPKSGGNPLPGFQGLCVTPPAASPAAAGTNKYGALPQGVLAVPAQAAAGGISPRTRRTNSDPLAYGSERHAYCLCALYLPSLALFFKVYFFLIYMQWRAQFVVDALAFGVCQSWGISIRVTGRHTRRS